MDHPNFDEFAKGVMAMLLAGDDPTLEVLRTQYRTATIRSTQFSGAGFFIDFSLPASSPRLGTPCDFEVGDVVAVADQTGDLLGFELFVRDGAIAFFEGFTYGDKGWPDNLGPYRLTYCNKNGDLAIVRGLWRPS